MKRLGVYLGVSAIGIVLGTLAAAEPPALRYADAMQRELESMGVQPSCTSEPKARYHCTYASRATAGGHGSTMHAVYSDDSDTVYFYLERYLVLPADGPRTPMVLRRLMELNWELLIGKLEWSPRTGEVRLSAILNTDSNFDRRAFRSVAHALETSAARYERELRSLGESR